MPRFIRYEGNWLQLGAVYQGDGLGNYRLIREPAWYTPTSTAQNVYTPTLDNVTTSFHCPANHLYAYTVTATGTSQSDFLIEAVPLEEPVRVAPDYPDTPADLGDVVQNALANQDVVYRSRQQAVRVAESRADQLLFRFLSAEQKKMYIEREFFIMETPSGNIYEIQRGRAGNVYRLQRHGNNRLVRVEQLCAHPTEALPQSDNVLAQKLMLETEETRFLRTANRSTAAGEVRL